MMHETTYMYLQYSLGLNIVQGSATLLILAVYIGTTLQEQHRDLSVVLCHGQMQSCEANA